MPEQDFENSFATLSFAELQQKAPGLKPYLIGFEVVEKSDDETHALGVFGFKVGESWYFAPVFWLNGRLEGNNSLYVQNEDLFVPMEESWINYITNKKPVNMGGGINNKDQRRAIMTPDFVQSFIQSPNLKQSSVKEVVTHLTKTGFFKPTGIDLCDIMSKNTKVAMAILRRTQENTHFADALYKFYSPDRVKQAAVQARKQIEKKAAYRPDLGEAVARKSIVAPNRKLRIVTKDNVYDTFDHLDTQEKETVMEGGIVVKDDRSDLEVTPPVIVAEKVTSLSSPTESGCYEVLGIDDDGEATVPMVWCSKVLDLSSSNINSRPFGIGITSDKKVYYGSARNLFVSEKLPAVLWDEKWRSYSSPDSVSMYDYGFFIMDDLTATSPFSVEEVTKHSDTGKTVIKITNTHTFYPQNYDGTDECCAEPAIYDFYSRKSPSYIYLVDGDRGPYHLEDVLYISKRRCKWVQLGRSKAEEGGWISAPDIKEFKLRPGTVGSMLDSTPRYAEFQHAKVKWNDDGTYTIDTANESLPKKANANNTLIHLVDRFYMRERDAKHLMKTAADNGTVQFIKKLPEFRTKQAVTMPGQQQQSYNSVYGAPTSQPTESNYSLPSTMGGVENQSIPAVDPMAEQQAIQAANSGQKDVFDTSVISSLLRNYEFDDKINDMLKDVILGNDRVGRILFMMYWHYDDFVERYGDNDMKELQELLKTVFKSQGDLVLFLKQKSIEPEAIASESVVSL